MTILRLSASRPFILVILQDGGRPVFYRGLIDTGASMTAVHPNIVEALRPPRLGRVDVSQVGDDPLTPRYAETYYFAMRFGTPDNPLESEAVGVEVVAAAPASDCAVLIGRDLLSRWIVNIDGPGDSLVIAM